MIISVEDFNEWWFKRIPIQKKKVGNPATKQKKKYKDIITAFDIETTRLRAIEQSIMYIWQWQFGHECTVVGRTWDEFLKLCHIIKDVLKDGEKVVVYVHNLSYEFQFLRGIYRFSEDEVFAINNRKVLKCEMFKCFEFRCSYLQTGMSLGEFTKKMGAEHIKLSGDEFDYSKIRYPWTKLSQKELDYCTYDVIGLVEALEIEMMHDNDNLYSIPSTVTGYVRRDAKRAMHSMPPAYVQRQLPDLEVYKLLESAFRGGNTHASRYQANVVLDNVYSCDRSSSYPEVLLNHKFPVDKWYSVGCCDYDTITDIIFRRKKAVVMRCRFWNIKLSDDLWPVPYISRDKCSTIAEGIYDNGRVLQASYLETCLTDIDFKILLEEYEFTDFEAYEVAFTRYGKLPPVFTNLVKLYYDRKTALKNVEGAELEYFRSKGKLNSLYGFCAQKPVKQDIKYIAEEFIEVFQNPEELLEKSNKKAFVNYAWGVWCTAWARWELERGIKIVENANKGSFVYCDTDSVKYLGAADFSVYNDEKIRLSSENGGVATDPKGEVHYMGVYENETPIPYKHFITLGAKKYCYEDEKGLHITVSGVVKSKGGKELEKHGGIQAFRPSFIFTEAGGTEAVYNDDPEIKQIEVDGHILPITSNVVLRESTYTLGITDEYEKLLALVKGLD